MLTFYGGLVRLLTTPPGEIIFPQENLRVVNPSQVGEEDTKSGLLVYMTKKRKQ